MTGTAGVSFGAVARFRALLASSLATVSLALVVPRLVGVALAAETQTGRVAVRPADTGAPSSTPAWAGCSSTTTTSPCYGRSSTPPTRSTTSPAVDHLHAPRLVVPRARGGPVQLVGRGHAGAALDRQGQADRLPLLRVARAGPGLGHAPMGRRRGSEGLHLRTRQGRGARGNGPLGARLRRSGISGKLDRFLAAAAARYDGNPESPSSTSARSASGARATRLEHQAAATRPRRSSATSTCHRKHFKRTLLAANDDFSDQGRGRRWIPRAPSWA